MRKLLLLSAAIFVATPSLASPIDGTWIADSNTAQLSAKPKIRSLEHGIYRCPTCVPKIDLPADGKFHPIKGDPYIDEGMVKVVDPHAVSIEYRHKGKPFSMFTATVSPDGKTTHYVAKNFSDSGVVTNSESTDVRVAAGPKGSHLISGTWRSSKIGKVDEAALTVTFAQEKDVLRMTTPTGESYEAKLGGAPVPVKGDSGGTMAAVRKTGPMTWTETDTRDGKLVGAMTMQVVSPTTMTIVTTDHESGRTTRYTAHKKK